MGRHAFLGFFFILSLIYTHIYTHAYIHGFRESFYRHTPLGKNAETNRLLEFEDFLCFWIFTSSMKYVGLLLSLVQFPVINY